MSASTEKKLRRAARESGNDKKAIAAAEEAAKKAKSKRRWTLGTIGVILLIAIILFLNSGFLYKSTNAVTIGSEGYSPAEVNYNYAAQYYNFANQYGDYAGIFGLDTSAGLAGLAAQPCTMMEEGTWRDYFLDAALVQIAQNQALVDYAEAEGISLSEDELAAIEANFEGLEQMASLYGFAGADNYLAANYGEGVNLNVVRDAEQQMALASKAASHYFDSLQYETAKLEEHYKSFEGSRDVFDYAYYYVAATATEVTAEDGTVSSEVSEEALAEAKTIANDIKAAYEKGEDIEAALNEAVKANVPDASCTMRNGTAGSSISSLYSQWMMGSRSQGDIEVFDDENGSYVVVFGSRDNNDYNMAQVRHVLIKAIASEDGTYSDEAKAKAKQRAEELLAQWQAGDKTEESFAALAEQYSEDAGSNTNGGLYDEVYKGLMVEEFDAFCFGGHKSGDTAIVYGESASYAGYHIMYYVGEGELYSNYIARNDLANTDFSQWLNELAAPYEAEEGFFIRLVG